MIVWHSFSVHVRGRLLLHVLTGPFNVLGRLDRLKYHSFLSNTGFLLLCAAAAALPFIHWKYPRRGTLVLAVAGSILWALFGAGFRHRAPENYWGITVWSCMSRLMSPVTTIWPLMKSCCGGIEPSCMPFQFS